VGADSDGFSCPSASDAKKDGQSLLTTKTIRHELASSSQKTPLSKTSFEAASMQHHLMLLEHGRKAVSSIGCEIWNGYMSDDAAGYAGWYSPSWGNLLSEYWEARGAAALAGVRFDGQQIPGDTWLSKLPFKHDADPAFKDLNALKDMCNECTGDMFPHTCVGKWTRIRQMIRDDTQAALKAFSDESHIPLPAFHENDMLVHVRLETDHPQVAYYAKSFFAGLVPESTSRIILLSAEPDWGKPILQSYVDIFHELCPR